MKSKMMGLLALCVLTLATSAHATHFRYGHLSWQPTGVTNQVKFNLTLSLRRSFPYAGTFTAPDGKPVTGDIIQNDGTEPFVFGDGGPGAMPSFRVTAYSINEDWIIAEVLNTSSTNAGLLHTYTSAGPFLAGLNGCCRLSSLNNRHDGNFYVQASVLPRSGNSSPVAAFVPIVTTAASTNAHFFVPAADPNGDTLRWRLATDAEAGNGGASPTNLTVNATTGEVTWNNLALNQANFWTVQIMIEDLDENGSVKTQTPVDFLLKISPVSTNTSPTCALNPAATAYVIAGSNLSFTVTGADADPGDTITINTGGLPLGATMSPALPTSGVSNVNSTFNWTPTTNQLGTYQVVFSATDNRAAQQLVSKTIIVSRLAITNQPATQTVTLASNATFSVGIFGTPRFSYQWLFNGGNISGETNSSLTIFNAGFTNVGNYRVVITNSFGSVTSSVAKLIVEPPGYRQLSAQLLNGGDVRLSYAGFPGTNYALDRTFTLLPINWVPQVTNPASADGTLVITNLPNTGTNSFWRMRSVP